MAIKIQNSTIIDDGRNIVDAGIGTFTTRVDVGTGGSIFSADANVSNDNILSVKNTSQNPAFDITGTGSVGIGITNPSKSLHVDGTGLLVSSGSTTLFSVESFTPNTNVFEIYDRENSIILGVSTNSIGIGSTNPLTITPELTKTTIGIGSTNIITLTLNGDTGIGTTNPTSTLTVGGDISLVGVETYTTTIQSITATADRYISFPDQTGVVALVQGINGAVQYNNAGYSAGGNLGYGNTTGTFGYIAGGGSVTQATNKSTGVTLNSPCGRITMNAANLSPGTPVTFRMTNGSISANDLLILNHVSGGTAGSYALNAQCSAGYADINVTNIGLATLGQAIVIGFAVIKTTI